MIFGYFTTLYRQIHVDDAYANFDQFCNYMSKCATFGSVRNVLLFDVFADPFQKVVLKIATSEMPPRKIDSYNVPRCKGMDLCL